MAHLVKIPVKAKNTFTACKNDLVICNKGTLQHKRRSYFYRKSQMQSRKDFTFKKVKQTASLLDASMINNMFVTLECF